MHLACKRTCQPTRDACRDALGQPGQCSTRVPATAYHPYAPHSPLPASMKICCMLGWAAAAAPAGGGPPPGGLAGGEAPPGLGPPPLPGGGASAMAAGRRTLGGLDAGKGPCCVDWSGVARR